MLRFFLLSLFIFISDFANADQDIHKLNEKVKHKTQVMIFGSIHLNSIGNKLNRDTLLPILDLLETYQPTAIAVESLRGEDVITMQNGSTEYKEILTSYVGETLLSLAKKEQQILAVSATEAIIKMNVLLENSELNVEQTVEVIKVAIAGYYPDTAALHWQYLNKTSAAHSISPELQLYLNQRISSNNERITIATALASKINLNRLYPIDDHLDKDMYPNMVEKLMPSYEKSKYAKQLLESEYINKPQILRDQALKSGNWLPLFLWINSKEYNADVINKDWILFADKDLDPKAGLARIALWEIRNLNMVSNIMRVVASHTGERVIIVVGSTHKVFLEQYLSNMIGVDVIQFSELVSK
ncbi:DUF5694 domain-containing protein [Shewanella glacialimarina]|jgi:hypothetical protein|uniref:DUF5694 domain-containing protein n=1 Tax=Shewanella glacialimarina TaxID=2590884 RepID=UPI001CF896AD|nr:DUF5694 domain-containing protein [Shewanella glacialimarina]UCX05154.1 hypothetical protein FJ709_11970 [Shewanella glacialimarina]